MEHPEPPVIYRLFWKTSEKKFYGNTENLDQKIVNSLFLAQTLNVILKYKTSNYHFKLSFI